MTTKSYFEKLEKQYGPVTFGGFLRAWREAEDISQTAFAKKVGLSVQNLNDIEKGRGAVVSVYTKNEYESNDLDFISAADQETINRAMNSIGFHKQGKDFYHSDTKFTVEFPSRKANK